ncbi:MAG TPA: DNA polymerase [Trebonia sp.]
MNDLAAAIKDAGVPRGGLVGLALNPGGDFTVAIGTGEAGTRAPGNRDVSNRDVSTGQASTTYGPGTREPGTGEAGTGEAGTVAPGRLATRPVELVATAADVAAAEEQVRPRWTVWSQHTARALAGHGVRLATCWDIAAVHRLLYGGWRADPGYAWACLHGQAPDEVPPADSQPDLFSVASDAPEVPVLGAAEALAAARLQLASLRTPGPQAAVRISTARCESTAELLCAELSADGLPVGLAAAENLLTAIIGPRPRGPADAAAIRAARDERVLRHAPAGAPGDLRSPAQVKSLLSWAGIDVPDTRKWRLEEFRDRSPLVAALLEWRKSERIATTYGYAWLDEHLGPDGRLRGAWTGSDGAAGRMTASSGLHNMPAVLRQAVLAEEGHLLVRADLGQIEPRVLAAVSGDAALTGATAADDMYLPVAAELGVDRPTAKVAMIAAMYGQTTGHGGVAGRRMRTAYPVAMGYLDAADWSAQAGRDLRTYGGRLLRMSGGAGHEAARGRYGRNAVVQGAAAELFKMWAVTVRARTAPLGARIVLCLHDELLLHVAADRAEQTAELVGGCLAESASRWAPAGRPEVRFIADITIAPSWAEAKAPAGPAPADR